ncbi:MAG: FkbM family methyltransferase [Pseudomonadota bacterium]
MAESVVSAEPVAPVTGGGAESWGRLLSAARFYPPLVWLFGPSVRRSHGGLTLDLFPASNHQDRVLYLTGAFAEERSMAAFTELVRGRRALVLDIGANIGLFSLASASAAGPGSRILAFEPNPVVAKRLLKNLDLTRPPLEVDLQRTALGDAPGKMELRAPLGNYGGASLRGSRGLGARVTVPVTPLAPYLEGSRAYDVSVLKIDVEGFEDRVLLPMFEQADPADWPDAIMMERVLNRYWSADLLKALEDFGYRSTFEGDGNGLYVRNIGRLADG